MSENFFDEQTEQSEIKATLVANYFPAYMGQGWRALMGRFGGV